MTSMPCYYVDLARSADDKPNKQVSNISIMSAKDLYSDALAEMNLEQWRKLRKLRSKALALSQGSFLPLLMDN